MMMGETQIAYLMLFTAPGMFAVNMLVARWMANEAPPVALAFWRWFGVLLLMLNAVRKSALAEPAFCFARMEGPPGFRNFGNGNLWSFRLHRCRNHSSIQYRPALFLISGADRPDGLEIL